MRVRIVPFADVMRSPLWQCCFLAVVAALPFLGPPTSAASAIGRDAAPVNATRRPPPAIDVQADPARVDNGEDDNVYDLEDKLLRVWIKYLIERLNTNDRSSNESTTNIQRIAKKGRTNVSTSSIYERHRNTVPLPVYPFVFNPFFHPTIYSTFIQFPHVTTTHLIPIPHLPYSQEQYDHKILVPLQTQYPYYSLSHVPEYISSTPTNIITNIKEPVNVQTYVPSHNKENIRKYDKLEDAPTSNITKNDLDYTTPKGLPLEEPVQINPTKDDETIEQINPFKNDKLLDNVNDLSKPMNMKNNQTKTFQDVQNVKSLSTVNELNKPTPSNVDIFQKNYYSTLTPMSKSDVSNQPDMFMSNSIQQIPSKNYYYDTDESSPTTQSFSQYSTQIINTWSTTDQPKQTTTELETELENINFDDTKKTSIIEERNDSGESRLVIPDYQFLNNKNATKNTSEASIVKTIEKSMEIVKIHDPTVLALSSTSTYPTNTPFSFKATEGTETAVKTDLNNSSIQMRSAFFTTQSTIAKNKNNSQSNILNSSTVFQIPTTKVSETTRLPNKMEETSTFVTSMTSPIPLIITSTQTTKLNTSMEKNNSNSSSSLFNNMTNLTIQPLNNYYNINSILTETKIAQTPMININRTNNTNNIKNISLNDEKSSVSSPTTTVLFSSRHEPTEKIFQNDLLFERTKIPKNNTNRIYITTEIPNSYNKDEMNHNFSITTKEFRKNRLKSKTSTVKPHFSTQKSFSLTAISNTLQQNKSLNQDRLMTKTEPTQTYDDSELWYNDHMNAKNVTKKELNEKQIDFLLKKLIKLLKPEIEKQTLTKDNIARLIAPKLGDQDKLVYIIFPWIRDAAKNMENEERTEISKSPTKYSDKLSW